MKEYASLRITQKDMAKLVRLRYARRNKKTGKCPSLLSLVSEAIALLPKK